MSEQADENYNERVGDVYGAKGNLEALSRAYDAWAEDYDVDLGKVGYLHPAVLSATVARHIPSLEAEILDVGCGTGQIGTVLHAVGYRNVRGCDLSYGMLRVAKSKKVYRELSREVLGEPLGYEEGSFDAVISAGTFTHGHAPASAFDEIARILKPGGLFLTTIADDIYIEEGFERAFVRLEEAGLWSRIEPTRMFAPTPASSQQKHVTTRVFGARRKSD